MIKLLIKEQFKDGFDAVFEHLANKGQGGHVSIEWWDDLGLRGWDLYGCGGEEGRIRHGSV